MAEKSVIAHCGGGMTVMVLVEVTVLMEDVAVRVKVVVVVRLPEEMEPLVGTPLMVGEMEAEVQFEVVQAMVDAVLYGMDEGVVVKVLIVQGERVPTDTVVVAVTLLFSPIAVRRYVLVVVSAPVATWPEASGEEMTGVDA